MVQEPTNLRLVVADDVLIAREGIVRMLESQDGIEVVAVCRDCPSCWPLSKSTGPTPF